MEPWANDTYLVSNCFSFMRAPFLSTNEEKQDASQQQQWVVLGLPFDLGTTGRAGTRHGPQAIRSASVNLVWEHKRHPHNFALGEVIGLRDAGDLLFDYGDPENFCTKVQDKAALLFAGNDHRRILSLGGDHFCTLPLLRAHHRRFGGNKPLSMIHFDAHTDTYEGGSRCDHGTMFHHAPKEGLIDPAASVQIGIRTEYTRENHGFTVIHAEEAVDQSPETTAAQIAKVVGSNPVYITFDIDCLDPAYAPGTGTPVAGGLTSGHALRILRALASHNLNVIGADVVEVSPAYDHSQITAVAASTIALEILYLAGTQLRK